MDDYEYNDEPDEDYLDEHMMETGEGDDGHTYMTFRGQSVGPFRGDY